jgi:hypothetical protein
VDGDAEPLGRLGQVAVGDRAHATEQFNLENPLEIAFDAHTRLPALQAPVVAAGSKLKVAFFATIESNSPPNPGAAASAFVEYGETLPRQRHGVKDYFPVLTKPLSGNHFIGIPPAAALFSRHRTGREFP